jgi:hypothetical protein
MVMDFQLATQLAYGRYPPARPAMMNNRGCNTDCREAADAEYNKYKMCITYRYKENTNAYKEK